MKRLISVLAALLMCFTLSITASAASIEIVQPFYEKAKDCNSSLYINGTTATCKSVVRGKDDVIEITADQYLQKQGLLWIWSTYDGAEWSETVQSNDLTVTNTKTGLTSGKYRLKTVFTLVSSDGTSEKITVYSQEKSI